MQTQHEPVAPLCTAIALHFGTLPFISSGRAPFIKLYYSWGSCSHFPLPPAPPKSSATIETVMLESQQTGSC